MAKTNWTPILKKTIRFITDYLESQQATKKSGGRAPNPKGSKKNSQTVNSKAKPSGFPYPRDDGRSNANPATGKREAPALSERYPGDYSGTVRPQYAPKMDGEPDPGEIVWTWVPYEEDYSQGKDRPVLLVGSDGPWLLGLMLSSKDHTAPGRPPAHSGPRWLDIGSGPWDSQGRDSEIRLDRVIRINPDHMRREGAIMPKDLFLKVAGAL